MWHYPAAVNLTKMAGWEEDGDCVRLRDDSDAKAIQSALLEKELQIMCDPTPKRPGFHVNVNNGASSSSKCCALTLKTANNISIAIHTGNGQHLKQLLSPLSYRLCENIQLAESVSIAVGVCEARQIGIARILVNEYGVDFNSLNNTDYPDYLMLFQGCNSTESCQSLIIELMQRIQDRCSQAI